MKKDIIKSSAEFSMDRQYRYSLIRSWNETLPKVLFIGLNPSTADENRNDPTISRCVNYAKKWGYGGVIIVNLFAFRSTNPKLLKKIEDPIGPLNDIFIAKYAEEAKLIVAMWGNNGLLKYRYLRVINFLRKEIYCLGISKLNQPKHILYLKNNLQPIAYKEFMY